MVRAGIRLLRATALRQFAWARLPDEAALGALVNAAAPLLDHRDDRLQMEAVNAAKCRLQAPPGTIWPVGPGEWIVGFTLWGEDRDEIDARREAVPCALTAEPPESPSTPLFGNEGLRSAYRVKGSMPPDPDPDRDQCGVAWFVPVLPLDGAEIASSLVVAQSLLKDHGFPPAISMRSGHDGRVKIVIGIFFDRARRGWDERARACHDALLAEFGARGHASYRRSVWTG